eukprot:snap_masked-scaffold_37-processed-gene-1.37-mRNA-1 protein AED:1.00 eAED:1.00 QI:0/-1/0/0/-1/1/1/0/95
MFKILYLKGKQVQEFTFKNKMFKIKKKGTGFRDLYFKKKREGGFGLRIYVQGSRFIFKKKEGVWVQGLIFKKKNSRKGNPQQLKLFLLICDKSYL